MEKIIFTKYSNERAKEFSIRTDICQTEDGSRFVRKRACYPEGEAHVENMRKWQEKLGEVYRGTKISMNRIVEPGTSRAEVCFEYLAGQTLEEQLDTRLARGDADGAAEQLLAFVGEVRRAGSSQPFVMTDEFRRVFGEATLPDGLFCAPVTDLDMIAGNAFVTENGWVMMDYEWTFDFPIPVNYVIFRILHFYIYRSNARAELYAKNLYSRAGLDGEEVRQYERMEEHFQQVLLGEHIPLRFLYPEITPGCIDFDEQSRARLSELNRAQKSGQAGAPKLELCVDSIRHTGDGLEIKGWSFNEKMEEPTFVFVDAAGGAHSPARQEFFLRRDVNARFGRKDYPFMAGFCLEIRLPLRPVKPWGEKCALTVQASGESTSFPLNLSKLAFKKSRIGKRLVEKKFGPDPGGLKYVSPFEDGLFCESRKLRRENQTFGAWRQATLLSDAERKRQGEQSRENTPLISVIVPFCGAAQTERDLKILLDSILAQTYQSFEICIADGSKTDRSHTYFEEKYGGDSRIHYKKMTAAAGASACLNEALAMAQGDFVLAAHPGAVLAENALYEIAQAIRVQPQAVLIYADEDKVEIGAEAGAFYRDPHFKPDFNLYMLRSFNYIGRVFAVRRELADRLGGFRKAFDGAQDYDFLLRCCEQTGDIFHVPKILHHEQAGEASAAEQPQSAADAWEAGRRALAEHYERLGIDAQAEPGRQYGRFQTKWAIADSPLISIVICGSGRGGELSKCLQSIYRKSTYRNFEVLVVSGGEKTPVFYKELPAKYPGTRVLAGKEGLNDSEAFNLAAREAKGEYLLFLDGGTQIISAQWLEELLGICQQSDVGAVGAKLFAADGTIRHAGVVLGLGGAAGRLFAGMPGSESGYMARVNTMQNMSAVTADCLMTKRSIFEELGGMDEKLGGAAGGGNSAAGGALTDGLALNAVDYCLRAATAGKRTVYTPYAQLTWRETERAQESAENRAEEERQYFVQKWQEVLAKGDPYYNKNLSLVSGGCSLRIPD